MSYLLQHDTLQISDFLFGRCPAGNESAGRMARIDWTPNLKADVTAQALEVCIRDDVELLVGG